MELISDYDYTINYNPWKAKVVANALSRKAIGRLSVMRVLQREVLMELRSLGVGVRGGLLA